MNFIRTFHPVGQGAFYTERHVLDNNEEQIKSYQQAARLEDEDAQEWLRENGYGW